MAGPRDQPDPSTLVEGKRVSKRPARPDEPTTASTASSRPNKRKTLHTSNDSAEGDTELDGNPKPPKKLQNRTGQTVESDSENEIEEVTGPVEVMTTAVVGLSSTFLATSIL